MILRGSVGYRRMPMYPVWRDGEKRFMISEVEIRHLVVDGVPLFSLRLQRRKPRWSPYMTGDELWCWSQTRGVRIKRGNSPQNE